MNQLTQKLSDISGSTHPSCTFSSQLSIGILFATLVIFICSVVAQASTQTDVTGGARTEQFGTQVTALPNGNVVVTDPFYSLGSPPVSRVGAVYLYNGATGALISVLTGTTANDNVGSGVVTVLSNGNYVVSSPVWDNGGIVNAGAVTFGNAATGVSGTVSGANSLVGSTAFDAVGSYGITALTGGNYVVNSPFWDNGAAAEVGAVTFGNGTTGIFGAVTTANSLVGSTPNDYVGGTADSAGNITNGVTVLTNGNYTVSSGRWDNGTIVDAGAVTFGNAATGTIGAVSAANSLVGSTTQDFFDGGLVTVLTNGNYVVCNPNWDNSSIVNAGAATFGNGASGTFGTVPSANSLVGAREDDRVSYGGVTALTNGNYVVVSPDWDNYPIADGAGAATFGDGAIGIFGGISGANSLIGARGGDSIGSGGVTALTNGNYVVSSPLWNLDDSVFDAGAATFGNGATGTFGEVSSANSLVGSTQSDYVGGTPSSSSGGVTALTNGNYVVRSPYWNNGSILAAGAATFGNGITGTIGAVSAVNSLVGSTENDNVGDIFNSVTALSNGNYVVVSTSWDNGAIVQAGAATFGNGTTGTVGVISGVNSLVGAGSHAVGSAGAKALSNGNYVVGSPSWNGGRGALTFGNGATGISGTISVVNSLVGSKINDSVGGDVTVLSNGNYVAVSVFWDNPSSGGNDGAITFGAGNVGTTGTISTANSVLGFRSGFGRSLVFSVDAARGRLFVGKPHENKFTIYRSTYIATSGGNFSSLTYDLGSPSSIDDVVIANSQSVTLDTNFTRNSLTIAEGATLTLDDNRTATAIINNGTLNLNGKKLDIGNNTLVTGCGGLINGASATGYIIGNLQRCLNMAGQTFPVGTANGYSPVLLINIVGTGNFTIKANQGAYPANPSGLSTARLSRYWTLTNSGITKADVTFNYLQSDILSSTESNYRAFRIEGTTASNQGGIIDTINNQLTVANIGKFSPWTLAAPSFEADVASRPNGDGTIQSNDVVQMLRFLNEIDPPSTVTGEFQRADSAPRSSRGNGIIDAADIIQTIRYLNEIDILQSAGGDTTPTGTLAEPLSGIESFNDDLGKSAVQPMKKRVAVIATVVPELRIESTNGSAGNQVAVTIRVDAAGSEAQYGFAVTFDPNVLSYKDFAAGETGAGIFSCTATAVAGRVRCDIGAFARNLTGSDDFIKEIDAGNNQIAIKMFFTVAAATTTGTVTPLILESASASDENADLITPRTTSGTVDMSAPAAIVSITGKVGTQSGLGLSNVRLTMTDSSDKIQTTRSSRFGNYRFTNIRSGETYILSFSHKRYTFVPRVLNVTEKISDLNFFAQP